MCQLTCPATAEGAFIHVEHVEHMELCIATTKEPSFSQDPGGCALSCVRHPLHYASVCGKVLVDLVRALHTLRVSSTWRNRADLQ